jgi:integrase
MTSRFTDKTLRSLMRPQSQPSKIWDSSLRGFGCRVSELGTITFIVMKRPRGSRNFVNVTLGRYPLLGLAEARSKARDVLHQLEHGIDPREHAAEQKAERERVAKAAEAAKGSTFAAVAEDFIARHVASKRSARSIEQRIRRELIPRWGDRPITDISRNDVVKAIIEIVDRGEPESAHSTLCYAKRLFSWAIVRPDYKLAHAPTDHIRAKDIIGARAVRKRVLADRELALIWRATEDSSLVLENFRSYGRKWPEGMSSIISQRIRAYVRLLLLTGVRRSELGEAVWGELDLDNAVWTIPAERTKSNATHVVPLSPLAVEILRELLHSGPLPRSEERVFGKMHWSYYKASIDSRVNALNNGKALPRWVFHDCRRTMRTGLSTIRIPPHVAELCIGHTKKGLDKVYDQYAFLDEKREALEAWETHLLSIVTPKPPAGGNVVALKRPKRKAP